MTDLAAEFMRQNNWANLKLIEFLDGLDEAVLDQTVPGTYGKLRETLVHMVASLERYHFALTGSYVEPGSTLVDRKPWPGLEAVKQAAVAAGEALEKVAAEAADGAELRPHYQDKDFRMAAAVPLVQAFNHCTDHRSQIATMLTQAGIEPPDLDAWAWGEATGRLVEL